MNDEYETLNTIIKPYNFLNAFNKTFEKERKVNKVLKLIDPDKLYDYGNYEDNKDKIVESIGNLRKSSASSPSAYLIAGIVGDLIKYHFSEEYSKFYVRKRIDLLKKIEGESVEENYDEDRTAILCELIALCKYFRAKLEKKIEDYHDYVNQMEEELCSLANGEPYVKYERAMYGIDRERQDKTGGVVYHGNKLLDFFDRNEVDGIKIFEFHDDETDAYRYRRWVKQYVIGNPNFSNFFGHPPELQYLNADTRKEYIYTPAGARDENANKVTTTENQIPWKESAPYVMNEDGLIYIKNETVRGDGSFNHSSFLAGGLPVCSGLIRIKDGRIIWFSNDSGHYKPSCENLINMAVRLREILQQDEYDAMHVLYYSEEMKSHYYVPIDKITDIRDVYLIDAYKCKQVGGGFVSFDIGVVNPDSYDDEILGGEVYSPDDQGNPLKIVS